MFTRQASAPTADRVLDLDPDLLDAIPEPDRPRARARLLAARHRLMSGPFALEADTAEGLGWLVVDGMLVRERTLAGRCMFDILGPGDVLQRPEDLADPRLASAISLTAAGPAGLLALDTGFLRAAAEWPSLIVELGRRIERQRDRTAVQALVTQIPQAEQRLLFMMLFLGDRWGSMTRDGIVVNLPLSHALLAQLVGVRRPTVSLALSALEEADRLRRLPDGYWQLTAKGQNVIDAVTENSMRPALAGPALARRLRSHRVTDEARALRAEAQQLANHQPSRTLRLGEERA